METYFYLRLLAEPLVILCHLNIDEKQPEDNMEDDILNNLPINIRYSLGTAAYADAMSFIHKLVKKSSLPLVKVTTFQKPINIIQIKVYQEEQAHLSLILIQEFWLRELSQVCFERLQNQPFN